MNIYGFPFYDNISKQSRNISRCSAYADAALFTINNRFLPFVIKKPADGQMIDCVNIYNASNNSLYGRIMGDQFTYQYFSDGVYDYMMYFGAVLPTVLPCGDFYLEIQEYYSEVFRSLNSIEGLVPVEWTNKNNIGGILYQTGFVQKLYLDTDIAEPQYEYDQEGDENEADEMIYTMQRLKKVLNVQTLPVPTFLLDALSTLKLHDTVHIGEYLNIKEIDFKVDWPEGFSSCLGVGILDFLESDPVVKMVCTEELIITESDPSGYSPRRWLCGEVDSEPTWQATGVERCL